MSQSADAEDTSGLNGTGLGCRLAGSAPLGEFGS